MLSVVPWSRSFDDQNLLLALNTDPNQSRSAWVDLDTNNYPAEVQLQCLYSTDPAQIGKRLSVQVSPGRSVVKLDVPAAGFVIFE